jgi:protein-tyrosine kinase
MTNMNRAAQVVPVPQIGGERRIGRMLEKAGKLSADEVELVLRHQLDHRVRFGEAAMSLGLISHEDVSCALSLQFSYTRAPAEPSPYPPELIAATQSNIPAAEGLRAIRAQLALRWFKGRQKRLAIASINPGDGASTVIANLAILFAQLGKRTLIVDANLRHPSLARIFNLDSPWGLSDILAERTDIEPLVRIDAFGDLVILPAGTPPPNPTDLISSPAFAELLDRLDARFDVILCDAPAVMSVADAVPIASTMGGVMFVARKNRTSLHDVRGADQLLIGTGIQTVGSILLDH